MAYPTLRILLGLGVVVAMVACLVLCWVVGVARLHFPHTWLSLAGNKLFLKQKKYKQYKQFFCHGINYLRCVFSGNKRAENRCVIKA